MHLWYSTVTLILLDPQGISDSDMKDSLNCYMFHLFYFILYLMNLYGCVNDSDCIILSDRIVKNELEGTLNESSCGFRY